MKKLGFLGLGVLAASCCSAGVLSEDPAPKKMHYDITVYNGYVSGNSESIVYRPSHSIGYREYVDGLSNELVLMSDSDELMSHLDWKLRHMLVNGVKASATLGKLHLMMNGWYRINASESTMVDRDWMNSDKPAQMTHISWSPSELKNAYEISAELAYEIFQWKLKKHDFVFQALGGYKQLRFYWESSGGSFQYYDHWGSLPDRLGIGFAQKFAIPYLGLRADHHWKQIAYGLFWKVSPGLSTITSHDYHALRFTDFYEEFKNGNYWMLGGNFSWNFRSNLTLNLSYAFDQLITTRGNTTINNRESGRSTYFTGGAGVSHAHQICTLEAIFPY